MAAYILPLETAERLKSKIEVVRAMTDLKTYFADQVVMAVYFTSKEVEEFGNEGLRPVVITVRNKEVFEDIIPEWEADTRNFVAVTSEKARRKFDRFLN